MSDGGVGFAFNHVMLGASAAVGAWLVFDEIRQRQRATSNRGCGACGGTGYVDCFCTKWDFSAVASKVSSHSGCSSCGGSMKEKCQRCNGSGRLIPKLNPAYLPSRADEASAGTGVICAESNPISVVKRPRAVMYFDYDENSSDDQGS